MDFKPEHFVGISLVVATLSMAIGGVVAALNHIEPSHEAIVSITGMMSTMVGALLGRSGK